MPWERLGRPAGTPLLAERELDFEVELSVVVARGVDGRARPSRSPATATTRASSSSRSRRRRSPADVAERATAIGATLAAAMDLTGTLTAELFLLRDGSLVVNELAPRVHNSGHWTIEGAATSQFEQHIRAICGLGLGSPAALSPTAMVNLLGTGPRRPARLLGMDAALADPAVHLHLYDKRDVFERRKMGHLTALGADVDAALDRARRALGGAQLGRRHDGGRPMTEPPRGPIVGIVGGSRSDFPTLEAAVAVLDELGVPSELKVVSAHRTPDRLFRYAEEAPGRGIKVIIAGAGGAAHLPGHARRQDGPAGHRRPDPDPAPRRPGFAAVDRPDAAGRAGRDGRHRQRHERRPAGGRDPGPVRSGPRRASRGVARPPDPGRPRRRGLASSSSRPPMA